MFGLVPSAVDGIPGFHELHLRKLEPEGVTCVYVDLTIWDDRSCFENWRGSQAFEIAHTRAKEDREKFRRRHPLRYIFDISPSLDLKHLDSLLLEELAKVYSLDTLPLSQFGEVFTIMPKVSPSLEGWLPAEDRVCIPQWQGYQAQ